MEKNINLYDKNNELVAQFLGLNIITDGISLFDTNYKPLAKYHESWNDLMPVVEKIEELFDGYVTVTISDESCHIQYGKAYSNVSIMETKIEAVYMAVVEFIKWFKNENKIT